WYGPGTRRECRYEFVRDEKGRLLEEVAYGLENQVVWKLHYTMKTNAYFADARGMPAPRSGSGAAYVEFTWTRDGLVAATRYFDRNDVPQPDRDGNYGHRFHHGPGASPSPSLTWTPGGNPAASPGGSPPCGPATTAWATTRR